MKRLHKNFFVSSVFLLAAFVQISAQAKVETTLGIPLEKSAELVLKAPVTSQPEIILSREQYVLSYNKVRRSANWVSWTLEASRLGTSGRSNAFAVDAELDEYLSQNPRNKPAVNETEYKGSCFDRGHQIPSADRTDLLENNETTFSMANMIPQTNYLNQVIWVHLETYARNLVKKQGKKLYIIAGPIYDKDLGSIGPNQDIPVPSKNFKIIYILDGDQDYSDITVKTPKISVIMPNIYSDGALPEKSPQQKCKPLSNKNPDLNDWQQYQTSLENIEKASGLKFSDERALKSAM